MINLSENFLQKNGGSKKNEAYLTQSPPIETPPVSLNRIKG